jgi:hypothetical protein
MRDVPGTVGSLISGEQRAAAQAIDLRWRGQRVDLLALDEVAETAWVIEIDSGAAHTVAVADLTWKSARKSAQWN